jgi:hypothetical protein
MEVPAMAKAPAKSDDTRPDARKRFEKAVDVAVKFGPLHKAPKQKPRRQKLAATKSKKSA